MARLPESYKMFAEALGESSARKLCTSFGGEAVYIPKIETIETVERIDQIRREATPYNIRELAKKYRLTDTRIRQIIKDIR